MLLCCVCICNLRGCVAVLGVMVESQLTYDVCAAKSVHVWVGLVTVEQGGWSCPVPVLEPHHTFDGCVHAAQRPLTT